MKSLITFIALVVTTVAFTQNSGIITGTVLSKESGKPLPGATVSLIYLSDTAKKLQTVTLKPGVFLFENLPFGYCRLTVKYVGYLTIVLDSIHLRAERFDFDLNEIGLAKSEKELEEVIVFAEKPLIENKDGKIIFNAGESALSQGATTTELLKQTPLVNVDNDGKVQVRGKDVKILIDEKPVELNAKQLQDLLESMPGSMIEKIEVMTTPPPQYANERGGVINIVTKKGRVGFGGRVSINYGTRGEAGISANVNYRKNRLALNFNAGFGYSEFEGNSYSYRKNIYLDSSNYFNTLGLNGNNNRRPNFRLNVDYDLNKKNSVSVTTQLNANNAENFNTSEYQNINRNLLLYRLSIRQNNTHANSFNPNVNVSYTHKGKNPKEQLKLIAGVNFNASENERNFFHRFLNPDYTFTGIDSTQQQIFDIHNNNLSLRLNYDKPLGKKLQLHTGGQIIRYNSHNVLNTSFYKKPDNVFVKNNLLSNDFRFHQTVAGGRFSLRYDIKEDFYINAGIQQEHTSTNFDFVNAAGDFGNRYWSSLPFVTFIRKWKKDYNLNFSYKRTIQRPGINELNPSVDYSDPYNTRFGNPYLEAYYADNFDLIAGYLNKKYNINASVGYNALQKIYSIIRTLQPDGKTTITWQNLSGRREYEAAVWGGYTFSKKSRGNISLGYNYNVYSEHDRTVNKYRNGGSFFSTLNGNYQFNDLLGSNASFTFNRFANPQGTARNSLSMNVGVQRKFFDKKFTVSLNMIDPFRQQRNTSFTYGPNFNLESSSATNTRNFRIALSYNFSKKNKQAAKKK